MKKALLFSVITMFFYIGCDEKDPFHEGNYHKPVKKYSGDLAVKWMRLQMSISRATPGFNSTRAFGYSGLSLYESLVEGMPGYKSVASSMIGVNVPPHKSSLIFFPASANAAMAFIIKSLIPMASPASMAKIDSLEAAFNSEFSTQAPADVLSKSAEYGRKVASVIFEWSKTDGAAEAAAKNASYPVPVGFGLWKPTPPGLVSPPVNVYANEVRTYVKNSTTLTLPPAPIPYSEVVGSPFYNQANEVYTISQSLTPYDILTVKTWGEFPGNYTNALRYQQIAIQLVDDANLTLDIAALAFAKHGMAINDAVTCVFNAKYIHNVVRPITYIRDVLLHTTWPTVNTTPPHPEYPSAHACVGTVFLKSIGKHLRHELLVHGSDS